MVVVAGLVVRRGGGGGHVAVRWGIVEQAAGGEVGGLRDGGGLGQDGGDAESFVAGCVREGSELKLVRAVVGSGRRREWLLFGAGILWIARGRGKI